MPPKEELPPRPQLRAPRSGDAFTLVELVAVMAVLTILTALAWPNFAAYRRQMTAVVCMGNMKNITTGLHGYLQDHGNVWPQGPAPNAGAAWEDFWLGALQPYGIGPKTWQCPGVATGSDPEAPRLHYTPTMFPPLVGIATSPKMTRQPWLIERGPGHGQGALICFQDGSIKSFDKVLAELGVR